MANNANGNNGNGNNATAAPVYTVQGYRRAHPGGGALGRVSFGIPGVPGITVVDRGMFAGGVPPQGIVFCTVGEGGVLVPVAMATPTPRAVAGTTSAVVATAN